MADGLTDKQRAFVDWYLRTWNGTKAARRARYKGSDATLAAIASENLRKPKIRAAIEERLAEFAMGAQEVLARIGEQARASITAFIRVEGGTFELDLHQVRRFGHLVKKIRHTKHGVEIELHDSQRALELLGKYHVLFTERLDLSGEVQVKGYHIVSPDDWDDDDSNSDTAGRD